MGDNGGQQRLICILLISFIIGLIGVPPSNSAIKPLKLLEKLKIIKKSEPEQTEQFETKDYDKEAIKSQLNKVYGAYKVTDEVFI